MRLDALRSVDSDDLEVQEQDLVGYHHHIACKNYDITIMNKVLPIKNLDHLSHPDKQDQNEENTKNDNSNLKTKKLCLLMMKQTYYGYSK